MRTTNLIRLAVASALAVIAPFASAQSKGGSAPAPAAPAHPSAPANPPQRGNANPVPTPPRNNSPVQTPPRPGNPPGNNDAPRGNGQFPAPGGTINSAPGSNSRNQRDNTADPRGLSKDPSARNTVIYVPWYGYNNAWWYGNSYWWPPVYNAGYDNNGTASSAITPNDVPTTPAIPAVPSPAQEQNRAANQIEGSPGYAQAMAEFKKAQATYDAASQRVLEKLKSSNFEYKRLVQQRDELGDQVEAVQAAARIPSPERVTPAAQAKLDISAKVTRIEQDAINGDPEAKAAKDKLVALNEQLTTARKSAGVAR